MKKSIYSITLFDDIVRAVDRAAYLSGTTRSGLINRLLAKELGIITPESRRRDIFSELSRLIEEESSFLINSGAEDSMFAAKSSISFKYNPTVKYSVSLYPENGEFFGELRATLRTQNSLLIQELDSFFSIWQSFEDSYFGERLSEVSCGRFIRRLKTPSRASSPEAIGRATARYIRALNEGVSTHFALSPDINASAESCSRIYAEYINTNREKV